MFSTEAAADISSRCSPATTFVGESFDQGKALKYCRCEKFINSYYIYLLAGIKIVKQDIHNPKMGLLAFTAFKR